VCVAYKRGRGRSWWKAFTLNFRRSRALCAWKLGHALLLRGIPTARPWAVCEPRTWGLKRESYLATQWLDGATNLHLYGWQLAKADAATRRKRVWQCASSLGRLVGKMHAWRVTDRDLKGCNLVVVERPDRVDIYLIDLDGVRIAWWLSPRTRARDLARLATSVELHPWLSRTDRLRFLRAYFKATGEQGDWKRLWQAIAAKSACQTLRLIRQQRLVA